MKRQMWRSFSAILLPVALLISPAYISAGDKATFKLASVRIAAGHNHWLAIKPDGSLWAWGDNDSGKLGDGTTTERYDPVRLEAKSDWVAVSVGGNHSVALKADGSLWTWGSNNCGQLGYDTKRDDAFGILVSKPQLTPLRVGADSNWIAISAGRNHTMALRSDGSLWAWGLNDRGQLGDGTTTLRETPVRVGEDSDWTAVSACIDYTAALKADGSLWAWGSNDCGQLGDGTDTGRNTPVRVGEDSNWAAVSAGWEYTVALKADGSLWSWGKNQQGQLGYDTEREFGMRKSQQTPLRVGAETSWVTISAGFDHTMALETDGSLWGWGSNVGGQLDGQISDDKSGPLPSRIGAESNWTAVSAGVSRTMALKADGSLWAWGDPDPYFKNASRAKTAKIMAASGTSAPKQAEVPKQGTTSKQVTAATKKK